MEAFHIVILIIIQVFSLLLSYKYAKLSLSF
jgi:hypothetical protein